MTPTLVGATLRRPRLVGTVRPEVNASGPTELDQVRRGKQDEDLSHSPTV